MYSRASKNLPIFPKYVNRIIQINLYGSPCGTFSDDLKIIEYKTKFDFVNLFKGFNTKNNNYNLKILNGYGHSFDTYNEGLKEIK